MKEKEGRGADPLERDTRQPTASVTSTGEVVEDGNGGAPGPNWGIVVGWEVARAGPRVSEWAVLCRPLKFLRTIDSNSLSALGSTLSCHSRWEHISHSIWSYHEANVEQEQVLSLLGGVTGENGGLLDDTEDIKAADGAGVLGGLTTLGVIEVGGDGNDRVGDVRTEVRLSSFLHLGQDHGGNSFGRLKAKLKTRLGAEEIRLTNSLSSHDIGP